MTAPITSDQIRALQATRRKAGLSDDDWHARLKTRYGVTSTKALTVVQANTELDSLNGSAPARRPSGSLKLSGPFAAKLQALWIAAWNLGIIRNRDDAALVAFVKRQTGIDHVRWVKDAEDADKAIEALKGWMTREARIDWSVSKFMSDMERLPQFKIAQAQHVILARGRSEPSMRDRVAAIVPEAFAGKAPGEVVELTKSQWVKVMNTLGEQIRDLKGA